MKLDLPHRISRVAAARRGGAVAEIFPPDIYYCKMDATLVALHGYVPHQTGTLWL